MLLLLGLAIAALLLPRSWTNRLAGMVQVLVPFQDAAARGADLASRAFAAGESPEQEALGRLDRRKAALENHVAALSARVAQLEADVDVLTGTRLWEVDGKRIGARGRLIPGRIVTTDLLPWRTSRLLNAGTRQGVNRGDSVLTHHFSIDFDDGGADAVGSGMAIVVRETLVGTVEHADTHTARIRLLSDPGVEMKVQIGRFDIEGFALVDRYFWLVGRGGDRMVIRDVERRDVDEGVIAVGDLVLAAPQSKPYTRHLPVAMRVGTVVDLQIDRDNPLLAVATVESPLAGQSLSRVYVYDPSTR